MGMADFLEEDSDCDVESHPVKVAKEIYEKAGVPFTGPVDQKFSKDDYVLSQNTEVNLVASSENDTKAIDVCENDAVRDEEIYTPLHASGSEHSPLQKRRLEFSDLDMPAAKRIEMPTSGLAAYCKEINPFKVGTFMTNEEVVKSLHKLLENKTTQSSVVNVTDQSTSQLIEKADMDFISGLSRYVVAHKHINHEYVELKKKYDLLQDKVLQQNNELELCKEQLTYLQTANATLKVKNESAEAALSEGAEREKILQEKNQYMKIQADRAIKGRRELLAAIPQLCDRFLDHPDVNGVISKMNKVASAFGKHHVGLSIKKLSPEEAIAKATTYVDSCIRDRVIELEITFMNRDFPILKTLVENPDASIE